LEYWSYYANEILNYTDYAFYRNGWPGDHLGQDRPRQHPWVFVTGEVNPSPVVARERKSCQQLEPAAGWGALFLFVDGTDRTALKAVMAAVVRYFFLLKGTR
jgi:hypothetical protein